MYLSSTFAESLSEESAMPIQHLRYSLATPFLRQKIAVGQIFSGQGNPSTNDTAKVLVVVFLCLVLTEGRGEKNAVVVGQSGDETFVECFVIEC